MLNAGASGTVNLFVDIQSGSAAAYGIGESALDPITVSAGNVNIIDNTGGATNTNGAQNNSVYVTDQIAGSFSAVTTGSYVGQIDLADTATSGAGALTIGGATNTGDGGAINLTETSGGGVTVSAPLGSATTGPISINAGSGSILFNTSAQNFTSNEPVTLIDGSQANIQSTVTVTGTTLSTDGNGVLVGSGATLSWTTPLTISGPTTVAGTLAPVANTYGTISTGPLTLDSTATTQVDVAGANNISTIEVTGMATLGGNLQINAVGALALNQQVTILTATGGITGEFANSSSFSSGSYTFSLSIVNDSVILTVTSEKNLDVSAGTVTFVDPGLSPNITMTISGSNYVISDPSSAIVLDSNATNAGWTGSGTGTVMGPVSSASNFVIETASSSNSTIAGITVGSANVTLESDGANSNSVLTFNGAVTTTGNLTIAAFGTVDFATSITVPNLNITSSNLVDLESNVTATGTVTVSGVTDITSGALSPFTPGTLAGSTLNLSTTGEIGTWNQSGNPASPLLTASPTIDATASPGGMYIEQTGAATATVAATGNVDIIGQSGTLTISSAATTGTSYINLSTNGSDLLLSGPVTSAGGNIMLSSTNNIFDNANVNSGSGTITITADSGGNGPGSFTQAITGATITTTNTSSNAITITVNTAGGSGTGNASIRTIADSGSLVVNANGGNILYAGTDTYSSNVTKITEATGSDIATVTPAGTTTATGATGFYVGEQVTIAGTSGVFDGTYIIQSVNSSGTTQVAEPSFTITTATAASSALSVTAGTITAAVSGTLEAQALGVIGSDGLGSGPTGEVVAASYDFITTGTGSIGTATRPIQTDAPSGNSFTLSAGSGGLYVVDWGSPITVNGATATGAGNVLVVAANAGGHNLTLAGTATTGSGNILIAADDELIINPGVMIGGGNFSGQVYLGANRDQGNDQVILDEGTIITSNSSVYDNTGSPLTSTPGAVLLEDYDTTGSESGDLDLYNITVGNGGSITATTAPTLGIYDVSTGSYTAGGVGSQDIIGIYGSVLNAGPNGTVNLFVEQQAGTSTTGTAYGIGNSIIPVMVSAGTVNLSDASATSSASDGSIYVTDEIAGSFTAVSSGTAAAGTINLATTAGALTISGATSTADGGVINLTGAGGVVVAAQLGSSTTGAINVSGPLSGASNIALGRGGLSVTMSANSEYNGTISGNQGVTYVGSDSSTLTFAGNNTYTGATTITEGVLQLGDGTLGDDGNIAGASIVDDGTLSFDRFGTSTYVGAISGNGTVTMSGTGTQVLTGTNTYTGTTTVSGGQLLVNGSVTSPVTVAAPASTTATLGGAGTITGSVTLSPATSASINQITGGGIGTIGTLNITGNLSLGTGSVSYFDITNSSTLDNLAVGGSLTVSPSAIIEVPTGLTAGTYHLITYTGTDPSASNFTLETLTGGASPATYSITASGGVVSLVVTRTAPTVTQNTAGLLEYDTSVTITGTGFDTNTANDTVAFTNGGVTGSVTGATSTTLTVSLTGLTSVANGTALNAFVTADGASSASAQQIATVQSTFGVDSVSATPSGLVVLFNAPINPATTVLYTSPGDTSLGAADFTVVGAATGTLRGSLVIDPTDPSEATFVQTSGLLKTDTYTVTVTTAVQGLGGYAMSSNYSTTVSVTEPTTPVLAVPSFARGPGQTVALTDSLNSTTGIPVNISNATDVTAASFTLTYDPTLLTIASTGALTLSAPASAAGINTISYSITSVDANHSVLMVTLTSINDGSGLTTTSAEPLVTILASVPNSAPYLDKELLNLSNVMVNSVAGTGVSSVAVVAYPGDVLGTGVPNATDASLVDQVGSGSGSGFSKFKDLDPVIIGTGGTGSGLFLNANDASLIDEAASGATVSQIPTIPVGVSLTFGGPDPYLYLSAVQGAPGQTVTETLYLDVTDPNGIQLTALDEAIGFDAGSLQISNVRGTSALAALGSYETASTVDNGSGEFLVGQAFMGTGLPPLVPYGTDIPVLQFNVTLNADMGVGSQTGLTLLQYGTVNNVTQYTAISDNEGALTWTPGKAPSNSGNPAVDGSVTVVAGTTPAAEIVESTSSGRAVVPVTVVEPVRRVTPVKTLNPSAAPTAAIDTSVAASSRLIVATTPTEEVVLTSVGPLQPSPLVTVQPEVNLATSPIVVSPALAPEVVQPASPVPGVTRTGDSGASLSVAAVSTNKLSAVALPESSSVKSSTSALDEAYRQMGTVLAVPSGYGYNLVGGDVESSEDLDSVWDLEANLVDPD